MLLRSRPLYIALTVALVAGASPMQSQELNGTTGAAKTDPTATLESRKPFATFSASAERLRESIVEKARGSVGTKYKLGASKPGVGFDCSGLVRYVMGAIDMVLPRTAQSQSKIGTEVPKDVAALQPGDVLTFGRGKRISHVGIYVGNGKMIHASTSKRRVIETSLNQRSSLIRQWQGVRRYVDGGTKIFSDSILAFADSLK
ncbi:MAG TPA: C40 family peptidase [Gemmatimonas sp.]|uniref:C40 family peptidase n=1 Tax=Gemmatimonas sp. TaxID=1962908 RepID=UPI002ED803F7